MSSRLRRDQDLRAFRRLRRAIRQDAVQTQEQLVDDILLNDEIAPSPVTDVGHETSVSQDFDVIADGGLRQRKGGCEVRGRSRSPAQCVQHGQSGRVRNGL